MTNSISLSYKNQDLDFAVMQGTLGSECIDIRKLYSQTKTLAFDPGFMSTASCKSAITYIDGDKGILLYRGYPIEQLAKHSSYLEVSYLLMHGQLPDDGQLDDFQSIISTHSLINTGLLKFIEGFRYDAHPMAIMIGTVGALSAFYHDSTDISNPRHREISAHRLISKMPTIAALCYKHFLGQPFMYPSNDLPYVPNLLQMLFGVPTEKYVVDEDTVKALDLILILHADHEQNASTSTVRLAGSSGANPFACIAAGISSLWGPSHGGANEAVIKMLSHILQTGKSIDYYINKAKDKKDNFRLMGFGHRVYKNFDPRAKIIREHCYKILDKLDTKDKPLFDLAIELEQKVLQDDYFKQRKLYPNVDFYSGIILKAIGIPLNMFTVIFAMGRNVGWISHWLEMLSKDEHRIGRPRQLYIGEKARDYPTK
ncbi:MAG: citrate (Si)-synthase [Gammaproteobacteria bacterium]|nr:MAG: citrate (Si)-synthase [Gammaproteobacteria bacterium]